MAARRVVARQENMTEADKQACQRISELWDANARKLGITQESFVEKYRFLGKSDDSPNGWNQSMVSNIKNGRQSPSMMFVLVVANEFGVSPESIFPEMFKGLNIAALSPNDMTFIGLYNQCPDALKSSIRHMIEMYLQQNQN